LIEKGADVDAKDKDGWTPSAFAALNGHNAIAKLLV
jgi:ankyrin repeat protein